MGAAQTSALLSFPCCSGLPVKVAATPFLHIPTASSLRGSEPLDAYHTSVIVGQTEFCFAGAGILSAWPMASHAQFKKETKTDDLGITSMHALYMTQALSQYFQADTYDLILKNCNSFTDCAVYMLLGKRLDKKYNRLERLARTGQKTFNLMGALRLTGMNYKENPAAKSFKVEDVIKQINVLAGQSAHEELIAPPRSIGTPCC